MSTNARVGKAGLTGFQVELVVFPRETSSSKLSFQLPRKVGIFSGIYSVFDLDSPCFWLVFAKSPK